MSGRSFRRAPNQAYLCVSWRSQVDIKRLVLTKELKSKGPFCVQCKRGTKLAITSICAGEFCSDLLSIHPSPIPFCVQISLCRRGSLANQKSHGTRSSACSAPCSFTTQFHAKPVWPLIRLCMDRYRNNKTGQFDEKECDFNLVESKEKKEKSLGKASLEISSLVSLDTMGCDIPIKLRCALSARCVSIRPEILCLGGLCKTCQHPISLRSCVGS